MGTAPRARRFRPRLVVLPVLDAEVSDRSARADNDTDGVGRLDSVFGGGRRFDPRRMVFGQVDWTGDERRRGAQNCDAGVGDADACGVAVVVAAFNSADKVLHQYSV